MINNNNIKKDVFGIIAGDKRQVFLAESIKSDGYEVHISGFDEKNLKGFNLKLENFDVLVKKSNIIVLPMPITRDNKKLLLSDIELNDDFFKKIKEKKIFCASKNIIKNECWNNMNIIDYLDNEDFKILNSSPTAEGALKIAMDNSDISLRDSKCLVSGFGRIGKILSSILKSLGSKVYITPYNDGDNAWADIFKYKKTNIKLAEELNFDFIFNTVPELIFNESVINKISKNCLIIDLASTQGVNINYAKKIGIKVLHELGVPGRFFPKTAAEIIKKIIYDNL